MAAIPAAVLAQETTELQGVQVTGSHIRRVDAATSDTVQVLDRKQIDASGAVTLGQLIQSVPALGGVVTNSVANNDPSAGASPFGNSDVNLRGLGAVRTLLLLDGHRINYADVASIPANMIERVEVLKSGAGAVYGTDAIGGVVNFITRKNFHGLEASTQFGETEHGDAQTTDFTLTYGAKVPNGGNVMFGMDYNKQSPIAATARNASKYPYGYVQDASGNVILSPNGAASAIPPGGLFFIPYGAVNGGANKCQNNGFGLTGSPYGAFTLTPGADASKQSSYGCYIDNTGPGATSRFNFQPYNFDLDPSERFGLFGSADIAVTDTIRWYGEGYYQNTKASFTLAPTPFTAGGVGGTFNTTAPAIASSASNVYNPFGTAVTSFYKRGTAAGPRYSVGLTDAYQLITGLKGTLLDRFEWNSFVNYGSVDQTQTESGILDFSHIYSQLGPNFVNANNQVQCGTAANPIALSLCTPLNVFAVGAGPNSLSADAVTTVNVTRQTTTEIGADINGDLFTLPWAGPVGVAVGGEYRNINFANTPDAVYQEFDADEQNIKATQGAYSVRELYGEVHVPLLKDLPGAKSLALNLGIRSAWYSGALGSTTDGKYAFEYKPYSDLLLRGSYNDVYRAPNVSELYGGAAQSAPGYTDPCAGLTTTQLAAHSAACKNVGAGFHQANPQGTAVNVGNPALSPEKGYSTDFGAVFNPSFYKPLTLEVDYWRYSLKEFISGVSLNQILDACFADSGSTFCGTSPDGQPWFQRDNHGNITNAQQLLLNSDRLYTSGWDFSGKLNYEHINAFGHPLGSVQFGADVTYLSVWDYKYFNPATGAYQGDDSVAGQVETLGLGGGSGKFAPMPRFKGLMFVFWNYGDFTTTIEDRYIGSVKDTTAVNTYGVGYANYVDVSETYKVKRFNTDLTFGINDIGAQGIVPLYDGAHAGAPATIYDPRGRNFYGRMTIHFK